MKKVEKTAVLYLHEPGTEYECLDCVMFLPESKRCFLLGADDVVEAWGTCGLFIRGSPSEEGKPQGFLTPEQVGYVESSDRDGYSCKRCEYFNGQDDCEIVDRRSSGDDPGRIDPDGCCNAWEQGENESRKKLVSIVKARRS